MFGIGSFEWCLVHLLHKRPQPGDSRVRVHGPVPELLDFKERQVTRQGEALKLSAAAVNSREGRWNHCDQISALKNEGPAGCVSQLHGDAAVDADPAQLTFHDVVHIAAMARS